MKAYMRFARKTKKITVLFVTVLFLLGNLTLDFDTLNEC